MSDILTPRELADYLRVSEATIRQMAARGEIPHAFRIGKQWRIPRHGHTSLAGSASSNAFTLKECDRTR